MRGGERSVVRPETATRRAERTTALTLLETGLSTSGLAKDGLARSTLGEQRGQEGKRVSEVIERRLVGTRPAGSVCRSAVIRVGGLTWTAVEAWEKTVVIWKHPGHLTSCGEER